MRIVATVGGGVRGYASALWWAELEKLLGAPIGAFANLTAGTSVGSILSCAQSSLIPMADVAALLRSHAADVFRPLAPRIWDRLRLGKFFASRPRHDPALLRQVLEPVFGSRSFGSLPIRALVLAYDAMGAEFCALRSWRGEWAAMSILDALLASSAAPGFFPAHVTGGRAFLDGGLAANDPSLCALAAALAEGAPLPEIRLVSVNAGAPPVPGDPDALREWGLLEWAPHILQTVFDAQIQTTGRLVGELLPPEHVVRVSLPILGIGLDEASSEAFQEQHNAVKRHLSSLVGGQELERAARLLHT